MRAYLTPEDTPTSVNCWRVFVPNGIEFEAIFRGALLELQRAYNWEQYGTLTPDECATFWTEANNQTFAMEPCTMKMTGAIVYYPSNLDPTWGVKCNGQTLLVIDYPELYAVVGNFWGGTPGTDFVVPDLRDQFILSSGVTYTLSQTGGAATHQLTEAELPAHDHDILAQAASGPALRVLPTGSTLGAFVQTQPTGSDTPHNNMPPYLTLTPYIVI